MAPLVCVVARTSVPSVATLDAGCIRRPDDGARRHYGGLAVCHSHQDRGRGPARLARERRRRVSHPESQGPHEMYAHHIEPTSSARTVGRYDPPLTISRIIDVLLQTPVIVVLSVGFKTRPTHHLGQVVDGDVVLNGKSFGVPGVEAVSSTNPRRPHSNSFALRVHVNVSSCPVPVHINAWCPPCITPSPTALGLTLAVVLSFCLPPSPWCSK